MTFQLGQPVVRVWDAVQIARLKELASHPDKLSNSEIAARMGWPTRNAVIGARHRLGIHLLARDENDPPRLRRPRGKAKPKLAAPPAFKAAPFKTRDVQCEPLHVSFFDLKSSHCRYPYGDGLAATYCGHSKRDDSSYCGFHHQLCNVKPIKTGQVKPFVMQRGRAA